MTVTNKFPFELKFKEAGFKNNSLCLQLTSKFIYNVGILDKKPICVSRFFITDGASIPRCFWSILSPFGEYFAAAVIHDFLYSKKSNHKYSRKECDMIFREAMKDLEIGLIKRNVIYYAVRFGGDRPFKRD